MKFLKRLFAKKSTAASAPSDLNKLPDPVKIEDATAEDMRTEFVNFTETCVARAPDGFEFVVSSAGAIRPDGRIEQMVMLGGDPSTQGQALSKMMQSVVEREPRLSLVFLLEALLMVREQTANMSRDEQEELAKKMSSILGKLASMGADEKATPTVH